jgi:DNA repair protein RecO
MSHHIYHTKGFIFSSSVSGEASRFFRIFTRELGFIRASAQGVRFLKSKLRYSLHDFSYCDLSLVRGKEFWRVTGAIKTENLFEALRREPEMFAVFGRVFALLERLLSGEEKNERLFGCLEEAALFALAKKLPPELIRNFEYILVLRILSSLGYLGSSADFEIFVESPYWSNELLLKIDSVLLKVLGEINKSLKETQL